MPDPQQEEPTTGRQDGNADGADADAMPSTDMVADGLEGAVDDADEAVSSPPPKLRYSISQIFQGKHLFYSLTMPSDVLARTCTVSTRREDPNEGFQRTLDTKRAEEIAQYIDNGMGTIPNSIVLSAQSEADVRIIGRGKTIEFSDLPNAFLILDGQHRVFGFSKAKTMLRVPVIIYNGLSRSDETRLFIDINTKQRPVPPQLLLDIKRLADIEDESERILRDTFDLFESRQGSALNGLMSPFESAKNKVTRVTFNSAVKPLLEHFSDRDADGIYSILNGYLVAISTVLAKREQNASISRPVVFRSLIGLFPAVAQRVQDKFSGEYTPNRFEEIVAPVFNNLPRKRLDEPGTSWVNLRDFLDKRLKSKLSI